MPAAEHGKSVRCWKTGLDGGTASLTRRVDALEDASEEHRKGNQGAVEEVGSPLRVKLEIGSNVEHGRQHRVAVGEIDHHGLAVLFARRSEFSIT